MSKQPVQSFIMLKFNIYMNPTTVAYGFTHIDGKKIVQAGGLPLDV